MRYKIPNPRRIKFVINRGAAIIPGSKGLISKYSGILLVVLIIRLGNITLVSAISTKQNVAKKIAHRTTFFR